MPLIETVTVVVAPDAKLPPLEERATQLCILDAVQLIELPPVFCNVQPRLNGLNGPPWFPEDVNPPPGVTARTPEVAFTVKLTGLVVFPLPLVVLVKLTVSLYGPAVRLLAPLLIETVTVVLAPAANVPPAEDRVTHDCPLDAVQLIELPPVF